MTTDKLAMNVLKQLYWLGLADKRPSVRILADRTCSSLSEVAEVVCWLDLQGLMDARRLRLTFLGLALAASSVAASRSAAA